MTPPPSEKRYDLLITLHRAAHAPIGDLNDLSCDPYLLCTLSASSPTSPPQEEPLKFRTPTCRRTLQPEWDCQWLVGGVPPQGVNLDIQMRDEDPGNKDDLMGLCSLSFPAPLGPGSSSGSRSAPLRVGQKLEEQELKVMKRKGSVRSHLATYVAEVVSKRVSRHGRVWVSLEVVRESGAQETADARGGMYTLGPHHWSEHFSPLLGHVAHTRLPASSPQQPKETHDFKSNLLQLSGPLPPSLHFQYVPYRPFVQLLFSKAGWRGWALNRALKRQHAVIYGWDRKTRTGVVGVPLPDRKVEGSEREESQANGTPDTQQANGHPPSSGNPRTSPAALELARQFLHLTSFGRGNKLFTYVLMPNAEWRFTETGEQFAVQFLSKHGMHSGVARWVGFSGEFFVRRMSCEDWGAEAAGARENGAAHLAEQGDRAPDAGADHDEDPAHYELVIDNDSGTYRPSKGQLPDLERFLAGGRNLCALGKVTVRHWEDEELKGWKEGRKKVTTKRGKAETDADGDGEGYSWDGQHAVGKDAPEGHGEPQAEGKDDQGEQEKRPLALHHGSSVKGRVRGKMMSKVEEEVGEHAAEDGAKLGMA